MDAQYFIDKFEAIPEENWCILRQANEEGQRCALGHFMSPDATPFDAYGHTTAEGIAAGKLFRGIIQEIRTSADPKEQGPMNIAVINNGEASEYQQETPKQRILAALRDIQSLELQQKAIEQTNKIIEDGNRRNKDHEMYMLT